MDLPSTSPPWTRNPPGLGQVISRRNLHQPFAEMQPGKRKFLNEKKKSSSNYELSEIQFKCEQCDHKANCEVSLRKHIGREHKTIPQLDGILEDETVDDKSSQTEVTHVKSAEVQTHVKGKEVQVQTEPSDQGPGTTPSRPCACTPQIQS